MGPLVPDIIGNELNYVVALLIGIAFGFVLEQAGFSSTRKLAGVFYGYDFTVLRVFFTAAATAMSGVLILGALGLLDLDIIYINPTFLWSAIVGGAIMGVGFIVGGFCPGTSICAMAIGKIDAFVFVVGGILGVGLFAEGYPWMEKLYLAANLGDLRVFQLLGMSPGAFGFLLIIVAVGAFYATDWVERRVTKSTERKPAPLRRAYAAATVAAMAVALLLLATPDRKARMLGAIADAAYVSEQHITMMSTDELAYRLLDRDEHLTVIDIRPDSAFQAMSLPGAVNIPPGQLFGKQWISTLADPGKQLVFFGETSGDGKASAILARNLGYENVAALAGGMTAFRADILGAARPSIPDPRVEQDTYRFRKEASVTMAALIKESRNKEKAPKVIKKISGGC